jgi:signal peptidase I
MKSFLREVLITTILAVIVFLGARATIQTYIVIMTSMEPNFHEGERVVVNKAAYFFGEPQRGDVVIFVAPNQQQDDFIKRVIGLPGDTVEIKSKAVYINGVPLDEPYIKSAPLYTMSKMVVPDKSYFVMGDNRNNSNDSHYGWYLPRSNLIGKAWLTTWPPRDWGVVTHYPLIKQLSGAVTQMAHLALTFTGVP